jgi:hypothetical protein
MIEPTARHDRPTPLSDTETRAALRAVGRVLDAARDRAHIVDGCAELADILDSAGRLPRLLARPELFRDRFRPTLEGLARRFPELGPALTEFDRSTAPLNPRPRRRPCPEAELWIDCGAGD